MDSITAAVQHAINNNSALNNVAGNDFLVISDTDPHTGDFYAIYVLADTVFNSILVNAANCVTVKGLSGVTVPAGAILPFRKAHATSIDLTSGIVMGLI